jgi:hypothetical protein
MASDPQSTDILAALHDPRNAGHLNAAAADEIERLRAALDDLEMHAVALDVAPGWQCICNTEWEQIYGKRP